MRYNFSLATCFILNRALSVRHHAAADCRYLCVSVYVCIITSIISVPISFLIEDDPMLQYGIVGGFLIASALVTIGLLLIPKVKDIHA